MNKSRALFIGRFQPFHLGHLQDIKNALKEVDELVIGVGSTNERHTKYNPFSVKERKMMINLVLKKNIITNYTIFPIPDFNDDKKLWEDAALRSQQLLKDIHDLDTILLDVEVSGINNTELLIVLNAVIEMVWQNSKKE